MDELILYCGNKIGMATLHFTARLAMKATLRVLNFKQDILGVTKDAFIHNSLKRMALIVVFTSLCQGGSP